MSRTDPQFNLRIPEELRDRVMAAAKTNKRSATAEIIARLEASFGVDEALQEIAPGAPLYEAGPIIRSLSEERDEALEALNDLNLEIHAKVLLEQFAHNTARLDKIDSRIEYLIDSLLPPKK